MVLMYLEQHLSEKHIEKTLSKIGAKVVKATEKSFEAKKLCEDTNILLMDVQTEIADLYERLDTLLAERDSESIE